MCAFLYFGCGAGIMFTKKLDRQAFQTVTYEVLPPPVQEIYSNYRSNRGVPSCRFITTDDGYEIKHNTTTMEDGMWELFINNHTEHYYIDGKHFTYSSNRGSPAILHEKHLYFPEDLNFNGIELNDDGTPIDKRYLDLEFNIFDLTGYLE